MFEPLPDRSDCFDAMCPAREILTHVTGRWGVLILAALYPDGVLRFSELRSRIGGISEKMLAQRLRELQGDGLLRRESRPVVPPYVDYRLTKLGAGVAEHLATLLQWIEANVDEMRGAARR